MFVDFNILNQLGSPAINSNTFANRPVAGQTGRLFVSTDTREIYRDTGTTWELIGSGSAISGSGTATQVAYFTGANAIGSSANLYWDNANGRLGINTNSPTTELDINGTGVIVHVEDNSGTANALIAFRRAGVGQWRIGDTYNGGANFFEIHNNLLATNALELQHSTNKSTFNSLETYSSGLAFGGRFIYTLTVPNGTTFTTPNGITALGMYTDINLDGSATVPAGTRQGFDANQRISFTSAGTLTVTQASKIRAYSNLNTAWSFAGSAVGTITHLAAMRICFPDNIGSVVNVTNNYGILINNQSAGTGTILYTNRWGIFQEGFDEKNYFGGNTLINSLVDSGYNFQVQNTFQLKGNLSGLPFMSFTSVNGGYDILYADNATANRRYFSIERNFTNAISINDDTLNVGIGYQQTSSTDRAQYKFDVNGSARVTNLLVKEQAAPATPASGNGILYAKTDNLLYYKNDAGTEYNLTVPATQENLSTVAFQALGSAFKGFLPANNSFSINSSQSLVDSQAVFVAYYLTTAQTITGIKFFQNQQGNYTADNYNGVGLYSYSGGTLTLVASSTNDGNIWKGTASTWQTKPFSATYNAAAGIYFICGMYNNSAQVSVPRVGSAPLNLTPAAVSVYDFTNSAKICGTVSALTALPATQLMSAVTTSDALVTFALY